MDIKYFFMREHIQNGDIELKHVDSESNIADFNTKILSGKLFYKFRDLILNNKHWWDIHLSDISILLLRCIFSGGPYVVLHVHTTYIFNIPFHIFSISYYSIISELTRYLRNIIPNTFSYHSQITCLLYWYYQIDNLSIIIDCVIILHLGLLLQSNNQIDCIK